MGGGDLTDDLSRVLADAPVEVVAVYLYGSRARGTAAAASDLDLGLLLARRPSSP